MSNVIYLNEICHPKQWETIPVTSLTKEGFPVYGANGIIGYYKEYNHEKPTLLITCRGATCGELNISNPFSYVTGNAMCLDNLDEEQADLYFLYYALKKRGFQDIISGTAQPQITREGLAHVKIPLPPLEEQKRIASLLARADRLRGLRRAARELCDSLLQSVFLEMFGEPKTNPKKWQLEYGEELFLKIGYGVGTPPPFIDKGNIFLRAMNIKPSGINLDKVVYFSSEYEKEMSRSKVKAGDVVIVRRGANTGDTALIPAELDGAYVGYDLILHPNDKKMLGIYFVKLMSTDYFKNYIYQIRERAAQQGLNAAQIGELVIPLPPLALQEEFARVVARVEALRARMDESARQGEALFQSLLAESFG